MKPTKRTLPHDNNGHPVADPTSFYAISDYDDAGNPQYFGYLAPDGGWYIQKYDTAAKTFRYASGLDSYPANWAGRANLAYDYSSEVF